MFKHYLKIGGRNIIRNKLYTFINIIGSFSILAIFIASLGLFGLSLFLAQKKLKEIVIRKTMGASIWDITGRLVRQYFSITILANILAMPVA